MDFTSGQASSQKTKKTVFPLHHLNLKECLYNHGKRKKIISHHKQCIHNSSLLSFPQFLYIGSWNKSRRDGRGKQGWSSLSFLWSGQQLGLTIKNVNPECEKLSCCCFQSWDISIKFRATEKHLTQHLVHTCSPFL